MGKLGDSYFPNSPQKLMQFPLPPKNIGNRVSILLFLNKMRLIVEQ
jgi:hypothetical protein